MSHNILIKREHFTHHTHTQHSPTVLCPGNKGGKWAKKSLDIISFPPYIVDDSDKHFDKPASEGVGRL